MALNFFNVVLKKCGKSFFHLV